MGASDTVISLSSAEGAYRVTTQVSKTRKPATLPGRTIWSVRSVITQVDGTSQWSGPGLVELAASFVYTIFNRQNNEYAHELKRPVDGTGSVDTDTLESTQVIITDSSQTSRTLPSGIKDNTAGVRVSRKNTDLMTLEIGTNNMSAFPLTIEFELSVPNSTESVSAFVNFLGSNFLYTPHGGVFGEIGGSIAASPSSDPRCRILTLRREGGSIFGCACLYMSDFSTITLPKDLGTNFEMGDFTFTGVIDDAVLTTATGFVTGDDEDATMGIAPILTLNTSWAFSPPSSATLTIKGEVSEIEVMSVVYISFWAKAAPSSAESVIRYAVV